MPIYLIPLLNGHRYLPTVWRIEFNNARKLAQGNLGSEEWALLAVDPPNSLSEVLSEIPRTAIAELDLSSEFYRIYGAISTVRNTMFFVKSKLREDQPFEAQLASRYYDRSRSELDRLSAGLAILSEQMLRLGEDNPAAEEWLEFRKACLQKIETCADIEAIATETFQPISVWQDTELEVLFGRYLNARYVNTV
jgi:hypothetical protein